MGLQQRLLLGLLLCLSCTLLLARGQLPGFKATLTQTGLGYTKGQGWLIVVPNLVLFRFLLLSCMTLAFGLCLYNNILITSNCFSIELLAKISEWGNGPSAWPKRIKGHHLLGNYKHHALWLFAALWRCKVCGRQWLTSVHVYIPFSKKKKKTIVPSSKLTSYLTLSTGVSAMINGMFSLFLLLHVCHCSLRTIPIQNN